MVLNSLPSTPEALRSQLGLRPLTKEEEGSSVVDLPGGVYGFTGAPGFPDTPLFDKRFYQCYEVHKLADESEHMIGYMTAEDAGKLGAAESGAGLKLYPEPWENATVFVSVDLDTVIPSRKGPSREAGNYLRLTLV